MPVSTLDYVPERGHRYTRTRLHAKGGIGQVWLTHDAALGRNIALKELRPERAGHEAARARFLDEARITGQLEHPGIVPVYELEQGEDGQPFYTMRFVKGRTLSDAVKAYHERRRAGKVSALDLRELLTAFLTVCQVVAYAHSRKVLHRDLKGSNVVLGSYGEVIVLDWGLAKVMGRADAAEVVGSLLPVDLSVKWLSRRDDGRAGLGHPGLHGPGAGGGAVEGDRQGDRRLRFGSDPLRDLNGCSVVYRAGFRRVSPLVAGRRAAAAVWGGGGNAAGLGGDLPQGDGQEARRAVSIGGRHGAGRGAPGWPTSRPASTRRVWENGWDDGLGVISRWWPVRRSCWWRQ